MFLKNLKKMKQQKRGMKRISGSLNENVILKYSGGLVICYF